MCYIKHKGGGGLSKTQTQMMIAGFAMKNYVSNVVFFLSVFANLIAAYRVLVKGDCNPDD